MKRNGIVLVSVAVVVLGIFSLRSVTVAGGKAPADTSAPQKNAVAENKKQLPARSDIKVTFVELGSVNCMPCKAMQPVMEDIEKEFGDQVKVIFHDVWTKEGRPFGEKYKIRAIPTQVFLDKDGNEYFRHQGFFPKEEIIKVLRQQGVR